MSPGLAWIARQVIHAALNGPEISTTSGPPACRRAEDKEAGS
jgi:hypothetical protein